MPQISCANLDSPGSAVSALFTYFLTTILTKQCEFGNVPYPVDRSNDILDNNVKIDFIVVGSGSSGSVIANRLSEISKWNVLLIEAGDEPSATSYIPALMFNNQKTSMDWSYQSEKQPGMFEGLQGGVANIPRGKALGGSSNLNAMMYLVGNPNDYNSWGNNDWDYKSIEKYFHKSFNDYYYAGFSNESLNKDTREIPHVIMSASRELNLDKLKYKNKNINPSRAGTLHIKTNIKDGERINTAKAFLSPIRDRPNLFLMKNTLVTKILLENKKATGVQIYKDGKYSEIKCNKEVVLSAGSINTPQILFHSGIGDRKYLEKEGLQVNIDLPSVGKYLYDHPLLAIPVDLSGPYHRKRKGGKHETEYDEANKDERKDHKKQEDEDFSGFHTQSREEHKRHGKKKRPNKHQRGKGKSEKDFTECDVDIQDNDMDIKTSHPKHTEISHDESENTKSSTSTSTTTTTTTTTSTTTTSTTTTPKPTESIKAFTLEKEEDDYDEDYPTEEEEEEEPPIGRKQKRSPKHKNKKNKQGSTTTVAPDLKTFTSAPTSDIPPSIDIYNYIMERSGPLSGIGTCDYVTFLDTTGRNPSNPNIEIMYLYFAHKDKPGMRSILNAYNYDPAIINALFENTNDIILISPMLLKPLSYGNVTLSQDPLGKPKIFLNYFQDNEDLNTMIKSIRFVEKLIETKPFKKLNARIAKLPKSVCDSWSYNSDDYWKCVLRQRTTSCYHVSSTARMGDNEQTSVVDYKLRVHGIDNVRIADASVMPYTVSANIHATCVMIGEKCSDLIKADWKV